MAQRPPRDLDWLPDDTTGIQVPSGTKQGLGWLIEKPARQFFNWFWNRLSRWQHYHSGQSQEWIVIDSVNANEKDYNTFAAYIADAPSGGDKVLIKESQALTAQMIVPANITVRILDGVIFTRATNEVNSVIKLGSRVIIEGVLRLELSHTGTIETAIEYDGNNIVGDIALLNTSTGTVTNVHKLNPGVFGNTIRGDFRNTAAGTIINGVVDNSGNDGNVLDIVDADNLNILRGRGSNTMFDGFKFLLGSDASGDIYYNNGSKLVRLAKGVNDTHLKLAAGIPSWSNAGKFAGGLQFDLGSDANGDIYYRGAGILKRLAKGVDNDILSLASGLPAWFTPYGTYTPGAATVTNASSAVDPLGRYHVLGDIVTVFARVTVDPITAGLLTVVRISLPIASNLTVGTDLIGSGSNNDTVGTAVDPVIVVADTANNQAQISFFPTTASAGNVIVSFSYKII